MNEISATPQLHREEDWVYYCRKFRKSVKCCMLPQTVGTQAFEMNVTDIIYSLTEATHCGSN